MKFERLTPLLLSLSLKTLANTIDTLYVQLVENILENGESRIERTNTGTLALFAPAPFKFDVSHEVFPLLTTKKINFRLVVEELLWMISGSSYVKDLQDKNVKIWNANATPEGRAGIYGMSWRFFGAKYHSNIKMMESQYHIDQLGEAIDLIMNNPTSRRIFVTAWNPVEIHEHPEVLPPCHLSFQFYVRNDHILDMQVYQRSVDTAIGLPFNIPSYSLLLLLISHVTDKMPGSIQYVFGDTHLYLNTIDPIKKQISRLPFDSPSIVFQTSIPRGSGLKGLLRFKYEDIILQNYEAHPPIKMEMSV